MLDKVKEGVLFMKTHELEKELGISKFGLTENIERHIIIAQGGISHTNTCVGGVDNGSNERLCCPSG